MRDLARTFVARLLDIAGGGNAAVALHEPEFSGAEWELVKDCLDSGWVSSVGKYVDRFESEIAQRCGARHGIAVVNGTAALHVALIVSGVRPGDEVIVPALTFVATANAAVHAGAVPHFADSAADTLGLDPAALRDYLTKIADRRCGSCINAETGRRIAAIVPMHAFGHPVDMDGLLALGADFDLPVIEDAAESLGSLYKGGPCGALGRIGALSFNGNKIITTGGGGAIVTNDPDLARQVKHLTTTAKTPHRWAFNHDQVGYNYRLPNINAALGCAQLARLEDLVARKRRLAERYFVGFADCEGLAVFREPAFATSNYWLNAVMLDEDRVSERDTLLAAANDAGLMCRPAWTLLHRLPMYRSCPRAALPVAEAIEARLINIPSSAKLAS
ncbi:LegC family aminotransferase [Methylocystis heyeri]|uniref:GDP-perosamine synthase n=1 Tax=Methylocystis heyeri TaxID=391905 RepID=A0A6B8KHX2_9HYPH|nr:LegC family aminotransferase [Methylocystis heyeri]